MGGEQMGQVQGVAEVGNIHVLQQPAHQVLAREHRGDSVGKIVENLLKLAFCPLRAHLDRKDLTVLMGTPSSALNIWL